MANRRKHVGVIRPTVPEPEVFWGSPQEVADYIGISYRSVYLLLNGTTQSTKRGYRAMTEDEEAKYYQPPKPQVVKKRKSKYDTKQFWLITFIKDWKKGQPYPKDTSKIFSGNPQDFVKFSNCNSGQIYRLINTHEGSAEKYPLKSIKGWTIARIRRYDAPKEQFNPRGKGIRI